MTVPDAPYCPSFDPDTRPPGFSVPANACDCHVHVFGAPETYPYQRERSYTPYPAPVASLRAMHKTLGISRAVIVQASVHGQDNRCLVDAVASDPHRYRGIATVGEDVTEAELKRLHNAGVRGIRVNLVDRGGMPFSSLDALAVMADRIRDMGWHIELLVHVEEWAELRRSLTKLRLPVSFGHIGYTKVALGLDHPGYREFLSVLRDGLGWVKLTGPYRISSAESVPYDDVAPFAHAVIAAAPDRVIWGSDWPHVLHYKKMPNDGALLDALAAWAPDETLRRRILVENPARLYGFV
jgi:2-pyrone-4,6-dicarboxylate lactonase